MVVFHLTISCGCATVNQLLHFEEAGRSQWLVHFPVLNTSLPSESLPDKMSLPLFYSFAAVVPNMCIRTRAVRVKSSYYT